MNREQISLAIPEYQLPWTTKGIFSDHYILDRLSESTIWPKNEDAEPIWNFCKNLWEKRHVGLARGNEELTKKELLEPVLERLGFPFLPQSRLPISERQQEPDYLLLPDEETKDEIFDKDRLTQYSAAVTLLEAKKVNHPLSAPSKSRTTRRFPHQQIRGYLDEATDDPGKPFFKWAILTSGNLWRLYCRDARPGAYFEFDFKRALDSLEYFKIFIALFSPTAFIQYSEGKCPLDDLREEALEVQTKLEDDLRKRIFIILTDLANGFYGWKENHIKEGQLDELYENCLIFLYRLLFILYAEGRALLPIKPTGIGSNKLYRGRYSLVRLLRKVKTPEIHFYENETKLYKEILDLFHLINGDQPSRNKRTKVPQYNGGLFDHRKYPLLEEWRLEERTLAEVLRGLMYSMIPSSPGETRGFDFGETIDYGNLEVRQLGSIYEGLLEHHLVLKDKRLVLRGDKAERKATGTYYTPDYIVQYIVENTLQPLCGRVENSKKVKDALRKGVQDNSFAEGILKLNVLDPAMGSGHFLVRATEFLADQIVFHPTTALHFKEWPRGLSHEEAEIAYWRRRVVESCIYGVDLNPLAVELAKLSLWLTCISADQPLNFLDHHLHPGNSLIGAEIAYLGSISDKRRITQASFSFGPDLEKATSEAIQALAMIEAVESSDLSIIKEKEKWWESEVHKRLQPYRDIADIWAASSFGLKIEDPDYQHLAKLLISKPKARSKVHRELKVMHEPHLEFIRQLKVKYLFHWELEFPEVFFKKSGKLSRSGGFDAVIGNPPYVGFQGQVQDRHFIRQHYQSARGRFDLYIPFVERGLAVLCEDGLLGLICPTNFTKRAHGAELRGLISKENTILDITDFEDLPIFKGALNYTGVFIIQKTRPKQQHKATYRRRSFDSPEISIAQSELGKDVWVFRTPEASILVLKIESQTVSLLEEITQGISEGIVTGNNSVFLLPINTAKKLGLEEQILSPCVRGKQVRRYCLEPVTELLIYPYRLVGGKTSVISESELQQFERIWRYLTSRRQDLAGRDYFESSRKLWYELWCERDLGLIGKRKIVVPELAEHNRFAISEEQQLYGDTACGITFRQDLREQLEYILGLLNSRLLEFYYHRVTVPKANRFFIYKTMFLRRIPIRRIDFNDPSDKAYHDRMVTLVEKVLASNKKLPDAVMESEKITLQDEISQIEQEIDQLVYELYGLTGEEIAIVEGSINK